ncbi:hypothetical protein HD554DRAFT_1992931, partial [Boletus coccyginus]
VRYLTRHSGFVVNVNSTQMIFCRPPTTALLVTTINDNNAAFLDGTTEAISHYANPGTSVPLDLALWHRRLAHHNVAEVKALIEHNMITGLDLDVKTPPYPVCEPCLAGRMNANPFPSTEWRASRPLELVHTDVHEVPYRTFTGCRYWVTFIDD